MIDYATTLGYSTLLDQLSVHALADLNALIGSVSDQSKAVQVEALMDTLPELGNMYGSASSEVSAQFFDELMQAQEVKRPISPESFVEMPPSYWQSLVGWGTSNGSLDWPMLAGGLTRRLTEMSADTMVGNAEMQGGLSAQRVARPGCCAFCAMLASRGADYTTATAGKVGGRGVPVEQNKRAKGIRSRGSQRIGDDFHDYCRCRVVTVTKNNYAQLTKEADKYVGLYVKARNKIDGGLERSVTTSIVGGRRKNKYEYIDAEGESTTAKSRTNDVINYMRREMYVSKRK